MHESGPTFLNHGGGLSLEEWLSNNPDALGDRVVKKWGSNLPFPFKVLSVEKALSIQAHPDKELARALHKSQPILCKDENHKPEMALALTEFEALCGFISLKKRQLTDKEMLMLGLEGQYPDDAGVLAAFLLNYVKLNRGEALCIGANEPHSYIRDECFERMATSGNVVRSGLTSKHRDIQPLLSLLARKQLMNDIYLHKTVPECLMYPNYESIIQKNCLSLFQGFPEILKGFSLNSYGIRYLPPFEEFEVDHCIIPQSASVVFPLMGGHLFFSSLLEMALNRQDFPRNRLLKRVKFYLFLPTWSLQ